MSHRKPTIMHLIAGNPSNKTLNKHEPKPRETGVSCPQWLTGNAKKFWKEISPMLRRLQVLTETDKHNFISLCECLAVIRECVEQRQKFGVVVKDRHGDAKINPYLKAQFEATDRALRHLIEFGMTPASRSRIIAGAKLGKISRSMPNPVGAETNEQPNGESEQRASDEIRLRVFGKRTA